MKLNGRVALITGGGSGMGRAMALAFAANGARVAVVDVDELTARTTAETVVSLGGQAMALQCDVSSASPVAATVALASQSLGPISILCSNAGVLDNYAPVLDTSEELWDRIIDVNLKGMYLMALRTPADAPARQWCDYQHSLHRGACRRRGRRCLHSLEAWSDRTDPTDQFRLRITRRPRKCHLSWCRGDRNDEGNSGVRRCRRHGRRPLGSRRATCAARGDREPGAVSCQR